ncbi:TIGR02171 family protein [Fibrobacter sp. UWB12]|uniref:TIGR02171 family lipoprotein n=1 Tax=Fibrobacter sp. UWB12 TaxID=1896203 RepID=UPI00091D07B5|nr:TIGR02171 family protein [Fibrobacter sp. UWB12]SHK27367.1 TIGR02171 family protein [Fibrobacter sp. UWB12]
MRYFSFFMFIFALLSACSDNSGSPVNDEPEKNIVPIKGFVFVDAHGQSTFLGTDVSGARQSDMPQMESFFTYDFYIGEHEVTCGEYNALRKDAAAKCEGLYGDKSPITNVTFYDAVLYANAKSKQDLLDTVYTYTSASFDASGSCDNLTGLVFHENVKGYRLPTEAEWVYVASQGWNPEKGWNSINSEYKFHDVGTSPANEIGVYDMAGNVLEWVNDWLTYFKKEPVTNFVGGADEGSLGERVVKGGSYRNEPSVTNLYSRGDVYTVISSTKGDYLGFRLALGAIPNPTWLDENGSVKESVVKSQVAIFEMKRITGTFESKLVFRNDLASNLSFIDFGSGVISVVEIDDTQKAYHPDVSPDGKRVAYSTGVEGMNGPSSVYVRNLDAKGSDLVKLEVENAAIPRWTLLENGDTAIVYVSSAANNKDDATFATMSTWKVPFNNGKFGKPQKLFDGAYHGGVSLTKQIAVSGARLLRARVAPRGKTVFNGIDTVWYGGEQACNVSLANDGSDRTVFLDFGGKTGAEFVGQSYRTHERLLVADVKGNLIQSVAAPKGYTFDHTEWVLGGTNYVVATLANASGAHEKIVLINLSDNSVKTLVEGEELWHPCLWHSKNNYSSEELDTDSAGVYYLSSAYYSALELRVKMQRFWEERDSITAVALGSSRTMFALHDKSIKSHHMLNMAYSAGQMTGMSYLFIHYVLNHLKNLKVLVLEMSPDFLWYDGFSTWINVIYNKVPGFKYDENHEFWVNGLPEHFVDAVKVTPRPETALQHPYTLEDFLLPDNSWGFPVFLKDSTDSPKNSPVFEENYLYFKYVIKVARTLGIKVVVTVYPQHPGYAETGSFGVYGPKRSYAMDIIDSVKAMDVILFDENKFGAHDYTDEMAYNVDHLSTLGAKQFTRRLDSLLSELKLDK